MKKTKRERLFSAEALGTVVDAELAVAAARYLAVNPRGTLPGFLARAKAQFDGVSERIERCVARREDREKEIGGEQEKPAP